MEQLDETVRPLMAARDRIDAAIQGYLDKVAILRKRREALQTAMDLIRSGDDEIMALPTLPHTATARKTVRVVGVDDEVVEVTILDILRSAGGPMAKSDIVSRLQARGVLFSSASVVRTLKTCPQVKRVGERDKTSYHV